MVTLYRLKRLLSRFLFIIRANYDLIQNFVCSAVGSLKNTSEIDGRISRNSDTYLGTRLEVRKNYIGCANCIGFTGHYVNAWLFIHTSASLQCRSAYLFIMRFCISFHPIVMTRGDIIFQSISTMVSVTMRCACYLYY